MATLQKIAERLVFRVQISRDSWSDLLKGYQWQSVGAKDTLADLEELERPLRALFKKIKAGERLSSSEYLNLTVFAQKVFKWGGVQRSNSKVAEDSEVVAKVIRAALSWEVPDATVPMNSGWTKVAAFSSEYVEADGGNPQVIFDSRVAASLLTRLDEILVDAPDGVRPASYLPYELTALGYVPGRGGTRNKNGRRDHRLQWPNRYQRWDAQFSASKLVNAMRRHLNENLQKYGPMPFSPYPDSRWSTRGVEMVLFMDGQ
jgi:hypothetical protein